MIFGRIVDLLLAARPIRYFALCISKYNIRMPLLPDMNRSIRASRLMDGNPQHLAEILIVIGYRILPQDRPYPTNYYLYWNIICSNNWTWVQLIFIVSNIKKNMGYIIYTNIHYKILYLRSLIIMIIYLIRKEKIHAP